jgi:hypothetical protein
MCSHRPLCPPADHRDREAARTVAFHPEQGWSLLCNGVIGCPSRHERQNRALSGNTTGTTRFSPLSHANFQTSRP